VINYIGLCFLGLLFVVLSFIGRLYTSDSKGQERVLYRKWVDFCALNEKELEKRRVSCFGYGCLSRHIVDRVESDAKLRKRLIGFCFWFGFLVVSHFLSV
jgi:hypothetical protein